MNLKSLLSIGLAIVSFEVVFAEKYYLKVREVSYADMGAFSSEAEDWQTADGGAATAPASDNGADDYIAVKGTGLGLTPSTVRLDKGVGGKEYTLAQRTFGGKSFTLDYDDAQIINGTECYNNEEEVAFEAGDGNAYYAAFFPNDGLILKRGVLAANWNKYSKVYIIIGGKVSVLTSVENPIKTSSYSDLMAETASYEYRFLGEVSGNENAHLLVANQDGKVPVNIAITNGINYCGVLSAFGTNRKITINAARLHAVNIADGATFTIKGYETDHTVGDLTVTNAIVAYPRKNSGFTVTGSISVTDALTLDASGMSVTQADGTISLLKLAEGVAGDLTSDLITVTLPTATDGSAWAVSRTEHEIAIFPLTIPAATTITYDSANNQVMTVDWTAKPASEWALVAKPYAVTLSETLAFTDATNRLSVFKFAAAADVKATDFVISTPKTCDLPNAWIETATEGDVTTVYLVARPVVTKDISSFGSTKFQMYSADWSDGLAPHAGADYYILNATNETGSDYGVTDQGGATYGYVFPGESLTLEGRIALYLWDGKYMKVNLRIYNANSNNCGLLGHGGDIAVMDGTFYVDSTARNFPLKSNGGKPLVLRNAFSGSGLRRLTRTWSNTTENHYALEGDSSAHTGQLKIEASYNGNTRNELDVIVTDPKALGGSPATMNNIGVEFDGFPKLIVTNDVDYATANRAFYAAQGLRLEVKDDATFTLRQNFNTAADTSATYFGTYAGIEKTGAGTFAFAGQLKGWADWHCNSVKCDGTNNLIRVKEGAIKPLGTASFDLAALDFSDGTAIKVDPANAATADYGLRVTNTVPVFADGAVVQLAVDPIPAAIQGVRVNFLTVPAATPDLTGRLKVDRVKIGGMSYSGDVAKESVTVDGVACTRYCATYRQKGLYIICR